MNVVGVLLCYWISLTIAWVSQGSSLTSREYWAGGWFFGLPLLLLAPLYLAILRRLPQRIWLLSTVGLALAPFPLVLFVFAIGSLQNAMSHYEPWSVYFGNPALVTLFAPWYAGFGALLGVWVGVTYRR